MLKQLGQCHFDREPVDDLETLLPRYKPTEFQSATRSTIPLLSLIKDGCPVLRDFLSRCDLPEKVTLHFEFQVPPRKGIGQASHTDLIVRFDGGALALEAKWTEPRYETVREWLSRGKNPANRRMVFEGWLEWLQSKAEAPLRTEDFADAVYQMVHRAASACAQGGRPQLAYMCFAPLPGGQGTDGAYYRSRLADLHGLLGRPRGFRFHYFEVRAAPTEAFRAIERLPKGTGTTSEAVRGALLGPPLFDFAIEGVHEID
ncbi:MAG: hypothetical protein HYY17_00200 [Planctomycetes bacterium]|nr:hypothetical protein [Planctomycetota bacterium]